VGGSQILGDLECGGLNCAGILGVMNDVHDVLQGDLDRINSEHDQISAQVRMYAANKLRQLIEDLGPYVSADMDPAAGMVSAYVGAVKELGRLYQAQAAPRSEALSAVVVARMVAEARVQGALEAREELRVRELEGLDEVRAGVVRQLGELGDKRLG
jgi:hypothetical protein